MRGACAEHVPMLTSPLKSRAPGAVRQESPKFGPFGGFSSRKLSNPDVKQAQWGSRASASGRWPLANRGEENFTWSVTRPAFPHYRGERIHTHVTHFGGRSRPKATDANHSGAGQDLAQVPQSRDPPPLSAGVDPQGCPTGCCHRTVARQDRSRIANERDRRRA